MENNKNYGNDQPNVEPSLLTGWYQKIEIFEEMCKPYICNETEEKKSAVKASEWSWLRLRYEVWNVNTAELRKNKTKQLIESLKVYPNTAFGFWKV